LTKGVRVLRIRISKRWRAICLSSVLVFIAFFIPSHRYISLYAGRKFAGPSRAPFVQDPKTWSNPEILLAEANRLAWIVNWPKADPLYVRAESLFNEKGDNRNEIYARVGRLRAESEKMSNVEVSEMIQTEMERAEAKADPNLRLWCLVQKGYTDLEIN